MRTPAAIAVALAACFTGPTTPGAARLDEATLLAHLPGGNALLAGGEYGELERLMGSPMWDALRDVTERGDPHHQMARWAECESRFRARFVSGVAVKGLTLEVRTAIAGLTIADVAACARAAECPATLDPDGKYIDVTLTIAGAAQHFALLALADGAVYSRADLAVGEEAPRISRGNLEADVAATSATSAARDVDLVAIAGRVKHDSHIWFAATSAGTPLARNVGDVYGTLDLANGVALDVTAQNVAPELAQTIVRELGELQTDPTAQSPALSPLWRAIAFERGGDRLRVTLRLSAAQLDAIAQELAAP
jgi:hypothetical protein